MSAKSEAHSDATECEQTVTQELLSSFEEEGLSGDKREDTEDNVEMLEGHLSGLKETELEHDSKTTEKRGTMPEELTIEGLVTESNSSIEDRGIILGRELKCRTAEDCETAAFDKCNKNVWFDKKADSVLRLVESSEEAVMEGSSPVGVTEGSPSVDVRERTPPVGDVREGSPPVEVKESTSTVDVREGSPLVDVREKTPPVDVRGGPPSPVDVSGRTSPFDACNGSWDDDNGISGLWEAPGRKACGASLLERSDNPRHTAPSGVWEGEVTSHQAGWRPFEVGSPRPRADKPDPDTPLLDRENIDRLMYNYIGPPIAPDEFRNITWITMEADLQHIISNGLIPEDTLASAGLDPNSYDHYMNCVTEIREKIWGSELATALSILRGARRIFSASDTIQHVFRGPPIEVLANIYYDGIGVLPKDRMAIQDPFHYSRCQDRLCDE